MWNYRKCAIGAFALITLAASCCSSYAADKVTYANRVGSWDEFVPLLGQRAGIFAQYGIELEIFGTDSSAAKMQAVIAGSADITSAAISAFLPAAMKGVGVKMISSQFIGAPDILWYVLAESPIKSLKDVTPETRISFAGNGSTGNIVLLALLKQYGVKATTLAGGSDAAQLTMVMSKQIEVGGDSNGGMGVAEFKNKEVRTIVTGAELQEIKDVTVRALIANDDILTKRRDVVARFLQAYQKTVDWMYSDPKALEWAAELAHTTPDEVQRVRDLIYPKASMDVNTIHGGEQSIKYAVDFKRIDRSITIDQFNKYIDIVWTPKK